MRSRSLHLLLVFIAGVFLLNGAHARGDDLSLLIDADDVAFLGKMLEYSPELVRKASPESSPLHHAVMKGNVAAVKLLVQARADPYQLDTSGRPPLLLAVSRGDLACARELLKARPNRRGPDPFGNSALSVAAENGDAAMVELLFAQNAPGGESAGIRQNAFLSALVGGNPDVIQILKDYAYEEPPPFPSLILKKMDREAVAQITGRPDVVRETNEFGTTPLHLAARMGNVLVARKLLENGAAVEATDRAGGTPLSFAISRGSAEMVRLLLEKGANAERRIGKLGISPLLFACSKTNVAICELLLQAKANPNRITSGRTALIEAASTGDAGLCDLLLRHGADPESSVGGLTPLHQAASGGQVQFIEALLKAGARPSPRLGNGLTPLHAALIAKKPDAARALIAHGADVNASSSFGRPLSLACGNEDEETVRLLLAKGADARFHTASQFTPLPTACATGNLPIAKELLAAGAEPGWQQIPVLQAAALAVDFAKYSVRMRVLSDEGLAREPALAYSKLVSEALDDIGLSPERVQAKRATLEWLFQNGVTAQAAKQANAVALAGRNPSKELLQFFLEKGADPNGIGSTTPLTAAALSGRFESVKLLVAHGAEVNATNAATTPLLAACMNGHLEIARFLVENGARPDLGQPLNATPLHWAAGSNEVEMLRLFISKKPDLNRRGVSEVTPLNAAAQHGQVAAVKLLLEAGADPSIKDDAGFTPLLSAAENGRLDIVQILASKAKPGDTTQESATGLQLAAGAGNPELVEYLIKAGYDVNAANRLGNTPLHQAAAVADFRSCKLLLEAGADPAARSSGSGTPFSTAIRGLAQNNPKGIEELRQIWAKEKKGNFTLKLREPTAFYEVLELLAPVTPVNARDSQLNTPLHGAAAFAPASVVKTLIERKAGLNSRNSFGMTPFQFAFRNGASLENVELLVSAGADLKTRDVQGNTSLHWAALCRPEVLQFLLKHGLDVKAEAFNAATPLHWAATSDYPENAESLLEAGADPLVEDSTGMTPIEVACLKDTTAMCQALLDRWPPNRRLRNVGTLLHVAAARGFTDIVRVLIERGAEVNSTASKNNITPLFAAVLNDHPDVVQLLLAAGADFRIKGNGVSPLKLVSSRRMLEIFRAHGADFSERDTEGFTTFTSAVDHGYSDVVEFFLSTAQNPGELANSKVLDERTCLHLAAQGAFRTNAFKAQPQQPGKPRDLLEGPRVDADYALVTRLLLEAGADPGAKDRLGATAVHTAVQNNNTAILQELLRFDPPLNDRTRDGATPLQLAVDRKDLRAIELLLGAGANPLAENPLGVSVASIVRGRNDPALVKLFDLYTWSADRE